MSPQAYDAWTYPLCCLCRIPKVHTVYGAAECENCGRPCGQNYTDMRSVYFSKGIGPVTHWKDGPRCDVCGAPAMFNYRPVGKTRCSEHYIPKDMLADMILDIDEGLADVEDQRLNESSTGTWQ